jgi:uncharacterized SAM-dependent methyltransferase
MQMPEYYLTDCEQEILSVYKEQIANHFNIGNSPFDLIEPGAGDGSKIKTILKHLISKSVKFNYHPIDISRLANDELKQSLNDELPGLPVYPMTGDFFQLLQKTITDTQLSGKSFCSTDAILAISRTKNFIITVGVCTGSFLHSARYCYFASHSQQAKNHLTKFI